jgi:hypothetical protein
MPTKISPPSCSTHRPVNWYRPRDKHLRTRYTVRSRTTKHIDQLRVDESQLTESRSRDYVQAFARLLTNEDKAVLRQAKVVADEPLTLEERFRRLADEWSRETRNVSSLTAMASHPKYRQIVDLGWDVVPYLIDDLQKNKRYWLPALAEITKLRPYDSTDEGNSKIMIDSWVSWGKKKFKNVR